MCYLCIISCLMILRMCGSVMLPLHYLVFNYVNIFERVFQFWFTFKRWGFLGCPGSSVQASWGGVYPEDIKLIC